ncbi:partner of Y14 and mago isoform X2 [Lotus japonicus]|uniref:partner of Y14 and mago isoform X2 n=1 Tax=Lotus japonicus TaxID=34305 RepID=UPI00258825D7|nr:partner of Y14 and mago isoform X2 [Lotus japonicus]
MACSGSEDQASDQLSKTLKQGERILAPTRRPDGTLRKPIRIRAGYVPQEEVAIYHPKPALEFKKEMASHSGPPGYDPELEPKPRTKAGKRNERKKEKRLQAALDKDSNVAQDSGEQETLATVENSSHSSEPVHSLTTQMNELAVSGDSSIVTPAANSVDGSESGQDIEKRIRALKKKIRLTEALQQKSAEQDLKPEQLEKLAKLDDWRKELKQLEDK